MKNLRLLFTTAMLSFAVLASFAALAHDVPDRVQISAFLKPEPGRMVILVRVPANALIDYVLPALPDSNWLDLKNADAVASEAAKVWIADRLSLFEDGSMLSKPRLLAIRLSRVNDPSFATYERAMERVQGNPLPADSLVLQEQVTLDALLETPIHSAEADFSFTPRFGRLGVLVFTKLTFLPHSGGIRKFQYEGDPSTFQLDATRAQALKDFFASGFRHFTADSKYLLFTLCIALIFLHSRMEISFSLFMLAAEALTMLALGTIVVVPLTSMSWLPLLSEIAVVALVVYMGVEAIVATVAKRTGLAVGAGVVLGCAFAMAVAPNLQFSGAHTAVASLGFLLGAIVSQSLLLLLALGLAKLVTRVSSSPRAVIIILAGFAMHIAWRRLLEQAATTKLVASPEIVRQLAVVGGAVLVLLVCLALIQARRRQNELKSVTTIV